MKMTLRFPSALLRSAAWVAALAGGSTAAFAQAPMATDPFTGRSFSIPDSGQVAYQDPATLGGSISSGPVYMAPEIVGGGMPIGGAAPGSPGCNCGPGGSPLGAPMGAPPVIDGGMMADPSMGGAFYGDPSMGGPIMGDPSLGGGMPAPMGGPIIGDPGLCNPCAPMCDPCAPACPPACPPVGDPCAPLCNPCAPGWGLGGLCGAGGIYHGAGGGQRCGWSTGFSWVFLKPSFGGNQAFDVTVPAGGGATSTSTREFDYSFDLSPRVFVEYVTPIDLGFRATWFGYDSGADSLSSSVPAGGSIQTPIGQMANPGSTVAAGSDFDLDTLDFDLTQRFNAYNSLVNMGVGLRWASYEHNYNAVVTGGGNSQGSAGRQFNGFGPTVFAEWRRPIAQTGFSVLANIRGSMLFGEAKSTSNISSPGFNTSSISEADDFVAVGESQLGGEWSTWVNPQTVMYVQVAWESQYWMGVGTANDRNDDVGLFGFNTTLGFEW